MAKVQKFIEATKDERLGAYWLVLLFGGLRPSEALGLQWDDIQGDTISIQRTLVDKVGGLHFAPTKTKKSRRAVVVPGVVVDALKAHRKRQAAEQLKAGEAWRGEGLVFCNQVGGPIRQSQTRKSFKRLRKVAELPPMRIYDLRHSAATLLLEMGEDLKVVSERLGHSTITLTADTYSHVTRGMQERAAAKLDKLAAMG
jgi:integrase